MNKPRKHSTRQNGAVLPLEILHAKRTPDVVLVPQRRCLAIDGAGGPETPRFQASIEALFGLAYAVKHTRQVSGGHDFKVGPLEGHWSGVVAPVAPGPSPPEQWRWRLRIGVPFDVTRDDVERIKRAVISKKGGTLQDSPIVPHVFLESVPAQRVGRILHVGPYADEGASFALLSAVLDRAGLHPAPTHIEVYRNDPRRARPDRLETVLLRELAA